MIRLYPEQLRAQLNEGLRAAYLLLGNDPLLLQESRTLFVWRLRRKASKSTTLLLSIPVPTGDRFLTLPGDEPVRQPSNAGAATAGKRA